MSAIGAGHDAPTRNGRLHALSDVELAASGLGWTVVRPAYFMQNLLGSVDGGTFYGAPGKGRIDVRDIMRTAAIEHGQAGLCFGGARAMTRTVDLATLALQRPSQEIVISGPL